MIAQILGISGSPIRNSNTDRAVKAILEHTGLASEFIKLSDLDIQPCRGCLGCKENNECVVKDDGRALAEKFRHARAFVLGAFTSYCSLDARTKAFMERMYCLRHQNGLNRGKIGAAVITTVCPPGHPAMPPAAETARSQVAWWMMEEGMTNLGAMILMGNVPCIRCGHGDECAMTGVKLVHGPDATVDSIGVQDFGDHAASMTAAKELGEKIGRTANEQSVATGP